MQKDRAAQRQTCKVCGRPDKFDFNVPADVWANIVPKKFRNHVVCLYCFDDFAHDKGADYAASLREVWFAGDRVVLRLRVEQAVTI
jgi:hypothetical protein